MTNRDLTAVAAVRHSSFHIRHCVGQARGEIDKLDQRTDVYALGAMLYWMLAGRPPYEGDSSWNVLHQLLSGPPVPPSRAAPERQIPWELEAVVNRAIDPQQNRRYPDAGALKQDLVAWLDGRLLAAAHYSTWQVIVKWAGRNKAAVAILAVLLIAGATSFAGIYRQMLVARKKEREAQAARKTAEAEREQARRNLDDFQSMSDVKRLAELEEELAKLGPQGWKVPRIQRWLEAAQKMRTRIPRHERVLARLQRRRDLDQAQRWQLSVVRDLLPRLHEFGGKIDEVAGWPAAAAATRKRTVDAHRAAWERALAAIGRHPRYGSLRLAPQDGLVPLGPDPTSGLWEFVHQPSGAAPARRDDARRWVTEPATGIMLVLVPGGTFQMGGGKEDDEKPAHPVTLKPFFLGKYEVTQAQWRRLARAAGLPRDRWRPSQWKPGKNWVFHGGKRASVEPYSETNPVERVSWDDCTTLFARAGLALPTEAQWEYAARAGTTTVWWSGARPPRSARAARATSPMPATATAAAVRPPSPGVTAT